MALSQRTVSVTAALALHAAVLAALLQLDAVRKPLLEAVPLMVNLITPPKPEPPPPELIPPKPLPVARQPLPPRPSQPPPLLAVETTVPGASAVAPQPRPEPQSTPAAPTAPPRIVPPSFDAAYLKNPPPAYPLMSKRRGEQGKVMLRVRVSADGAAEDVQVRSSSGHERLDQAALEAVRQWRFVPARQGEQPVAAWVLVPIVFSLEG